MLFKPYKHFLLTDRLQVYIYGKPHNWSMHNQKSWKNVAMLADTLNVTKIYSPFPEEFNTRICQQEDFIEYDPGISKTVKIFRTPKGNPAEGALIPQGAAFWTTSADCPMILIYDDKQAVATHSGRDSLVTYDPYQSKIRPNESVIDGMIKLFPESKHSQLKVFFVNRIAPEHFANPINDPKNGERNKKIINAVIKKWGKECIVGNLNEGHISLATLILKQCEFYGILSKNIIDGGLDTFSDSHLWSHRQGNMERNRILVIHHVK
ncbi:laccase domain-containing protein [Candidatus Parcubacteria bacterium]|nr:laccase domain-containing protein [Candidatus Parcubacteria bacterium]